MKYSICIVVIPSADLLLDYVSLLFNDVGVQRCPHFTHMERLIFILGIALQSTKYFLRNITDSYTLGLANSCIDNTSILLLIGPIIQFLGRCASNFTATKSLYVVLLFIFGILCRTLYYFSKVSSTVQKGLLMTGSSIFTSGCVLYGFLVSQFIASHLCENMRSSKTRQAFAKRLCEVFRTKFEQ